MKKIIMIGILVTVTVLLHGCSKDKAGQATVLETDITEIKSKAEQTAFSILAAKEETKATEDTTAQPIDTEQDTEVTEAETERQVPETQPQLQQTVQQQEPPATQPEQPITEPQQQETQAEQPVTEQQQPETQPETQQPLVPKSIYDYEFDVEAIKAELIAIGESKGLEHVTTDNGVACTPDNSSWAMPVTASQSFQGEPLKRALQDYVASMPEVIKMSGGEINSFTIYVESLGNGSYTFYFLY